MERTETSGSLDAPRRPAAAVTFAAVLVVMAAAVWWVTRPDALLDPSGTVAFPAAVGQSVYVGHVAMASDRVTVERLEPVVLTSGLEATVWVCEPVPGSDPIGTAGPEDLDEYCAELSPAGPGTVLEPHDGPDRLAPYLLTELRPTVDDPQVLCGLDVTYRDGWRTGRQRQAGTVLVTVNPPPVRPGEGLDGPLETTGCLG